jgi:hypothetical protein
VPDSAANPATAVAPRNDRRFKFDTYPPMVWSSAHRDLCHVHVRSKTRQMRTVVSSFSGVRQNKSGISQRRRYDLKPSSSRICASSNRMTDSATRMSTRSIPSNRVESNCGFRSM